MFHHYNTTNNVAARSQQKADNSSNYTHYTTEGSTSPKYFQLLLARKVSQLASPVLETVLGYVPGLNGLIMLSFCACRLFVRLARARNQNVKKDWDFYRPSDLGELVG